MIKLFITDFDGTLTKEDILDYICSLNNKLVESQIINREFITGNDTKGNTLSRRINLLEGVHIGEIINKLNSDLLQDGVIELFDFLGSMNIDILICSGNIMPVLLYYKDLIEKNVRNKVDIDVLGSEIEVSKDNIITGKSVTRNKKEACQKYIKEKQYTEDEIIVFGDSISDIQMMELGKNNFFIFPKNEIDKKVLGSKTVNSIFELIKILKTL